MNVSSTDKQNKYLIAIGSPSCSAMGFRELNQIETDIKRVVTLLTDKAQGYKTALTELHTYATSDTIKKRLAFWFADSERRNSDCVVIYYAGHASEGREHNSHYLYTVESRPSYLSTTAIETSDLVKYLFPGMLNSPQNILLILDVCYAGQGAANVLVSSLTQNSRTIENVTFCVIASADSRTEAADGDFVEAFEKVMKESDWMSTLPNEFLNIEDLVTTHINGFLKRKCTSENRGIQKAQYSNLLTSGRTNFFRNPHFFSQNNLGSDEQERTEIKSYNQKIAELLLLLDYNEQKRNFEDVINSRSEGAFFIQAEEEIIQHWLIRRLAGCVPDFTKAKKFIIKTDSYAIRSDSEEFWSQFQIERLDNRSCESVIQALAELCQQKSVIIAMYGHRVIKESKITQIHNFWLGLVREVRSREKNRNFRSKLILLIAQGNSTTIDQLHPFKCDVSLAPLEKILQSDAKTWLTQEKLFSSLNCLEEDIQAIVCNKINTWNEDPSQMLTEICQTVFKIPDGIAAIEPYWKLTG